jgi:hypothetical protein
MQATTLMSNKQHAIPLPLQVVHDVHARHVLGYGAADWPALVKDTAFSKAAPEEQS